MTTTTITEKTVKALIAELKNYEPGTPEAIETTNALLAAQTYLQNPTEENRRRFMVADRPDLPWGEWAAQ